MVSSSIKKYKQTFSFDFYKEIDFKVVGKLPQIGGQFGRFPAANESPAYKRYCKMRMKFGMQIHTPRYALEFEMKKRLGMQTLCVDKSMYCCCLCFQTHM
jgi:hypothetical protein